LLGRLRRRRRLQYGCSPTGCSPCQGDFVATYGCHDGGCTHVCQSGHGDCKPAPGCETDVAGHDNCGTCGNTCPNTAPYCVPSGNSSTCSSTCSSTFCPDSGDCTDLSSDPDNCNACGRVCSRPSNADPTCVSGVCGFSCNPPSVYRDCNGNAADGCEADMRSISTCGPSCTDCTTRVGPHQQASACAGGACQFQCVSGFDDSTSSNAMPA